MSLTPPWFKLPEPTPLEPTSAKSGTPVVVVGCGLAGCHIAFELATRGIEVVLVDACDSVAGGASGNTAGIFKPFITRSPGRADQFYKVAFDFLLKRFDSNAYLREAAQFNECGVLQLFNRKYPSNDTYRVCSANEATALAGSNVSGPAVYFKRGGWLNPSTLCQALVQHHNIEPKLQHCVTAISRISNGWSVVIATDSGNNKGRNAWEKSENSKYTSIECSTLILANGSNANKFGPTCELPIIAARGQTSRFSLSGDAGLRTVVSGKRYAIPDGNSAIVGASFVRDNTNTQILRCEHEQNRAGLNALLPTLDVDPIAISGFCAVRATTPDRFPIVGPMPRISSYPQDYARLSDGLPEHRFPNASYHQGLYIIGGFGSRGIVSSPYCAKLLADHLLSSTDQCKFSVDEGIENLSSWSAQLHPARFKVRELRRTRSLI